jgi:uncharacterized membrane protein
VDEEQRAEQEGSGLEEAVRDAVDFVIPIIEVIGAAVVFAGALLAIGMFVATALRLRHDSYEEVRLTLGRHLALGLEFQLGSDILATAVAPSFEDLGKLGAIAAIRTVLNFFLQRELREEAERVAAGRGGGGPGRSERPAHGPDPAAAGAVRASDA